MCSLGPAVDGLAVIENCVNESLTIFAYRIKEVGDGAQPFIGRILATESVVARASKTQRQRTSAYDMLYRPRRGERNSVVLMRCVQSRNHAGHRAQAGTGHGQRHLRSGRTRAGRRSARSIVCCLLAFRTLFYNSDRTRCQNGMQRP